MTRLLFALLADWAVPPKVLLSAAYVPGCSCERCVPGCPVPAMTYLLGRAA